MANYPSYYPNNQMGIYQSPIYNPQYQNYQSYQPQYQQNVLPTQMSGIPQQQFQQIPAGINGKVVPSVENITANDVPMDGSVAFFPRQDMSEIYAKSWNSDGTIKTVVYKPFISNPNNNPVDEEKINLRLSDDVTDAFMKRFDDIADRIEKLEKYMANTTAKSSSSKVKKEAAGDE